MMMVLLKTLQIMHYFLHKEKLYAFIENFKIITIATRAEGPVIVPIIFDQVVHHLS
jgi:hypothetical protein